MLVQGESLRHLFEAESPLARRAFQAGGHVLHRISHLWRFRRIVGRRNYQWIGRQSWHARLEVALHNRGPCYHGPRHSSLLRPTW